MTSQGPTPTAGLPYELFRFEGDGNVVVLRLDSLDHRQDGTVAQAIGTIEIDCGSLAAGFGIRGVLPTYVGPEDLDDWQRVLDALDAGYDAAWRKDLRAYEVHVGWDGGDRHVVTVRDRMGLLTDVTTIVPSSEEWFDDAYDRLGRAYDLLEHR